MNNLKNTISKLTLLSVFTLILSFGASAQTERSQMPAPAFSISVFQNTDKTFGYSIHDKNVVLLKITNAPGSGTGYTNGEKLFPAINRLQNLLNESGKTAASISKEELKALVKKSETAPATVN